MKNKEILDVLINDFSYTFKSAEIVLEKILLFDEELREVFFDYLMTRVEPDISIANYSYSQLRESYQMNPIAAFLALDWLKREPAKANKILKKGFDTYVKK